MLAVAGYSTRHSTKQTLDNFYPEITTAEQLVDISDLVVNSIEKLKIRQMISYQTSYLEFISYCQEYVSESAEKLRGPTALSWDYYNKNGGYYENSQFLFGCAAQFC